MSEPTTEEAERIYQAIATFSRQFRGVKCLEEFTGRKIVRINYLSSF
jgi:hypothetical protein